MQLDESSKDIDNIDDLPIEQLTFVSNDSKSKPLGNIDPHRFKFSHDLSRDLENTGRGIVFQFSNYSQTCQAKDQPRPIPVEADNKMTKEEKEKIVVMERLSGPGFIYLKCYPPTDKLTFMFASTNQYVNKNGELSRVCYPCCRLKDPVSEERKANVRYCFKYDTVRLVKK